MKLQEQMDAYNRSFKEKAPQEVLDTMQQAKDALKNDPFILHHKPWQRALEQLVKMGVRAEQQALAK